MKNLKVIKIKKTTRKTREKKKKYQSIYVYPFNERGDVNNPNVVNTKIYKIHKKAISGKRLTRDEKDYVFMNLQGCTYSKTKVALLGVFLDFKPILKRFFVTYTYGDVREIHAPDKMSIRNSYYTNSNIKEIIEIQKVK